MSADNWSHCPKCSKVEDSKANSPYRTLREDYEIGIDKDGIFYVTYEASCRECDFTFRFVHRASVNKVL